MKPVKGQVYMLDYFKVEPTRYLRGTNIITEKALVNYRGEYEYMGHKHFYCNQNGTDIYLDNKQFNKIIEETSK